MVEIERVQTGVRMERRLLKVLKGLAEYLDISLSELLEGLVLHAFDGVLPFAEGTTTAIQRLKQVYGLDLTAADSHQLSEAPDDKGGKGHDQDPVLARPVDRQGRGRPPSGSDLQAIHSER